MTSRRGLIAAATCVLPTELRRKSCLYKWHPGVLNIVIISCVAQGNASDAVMTSNSSTCTSPLSLSVAHVLFSHDNESRVLWLVRLFKIHNVESHEPRRVWWTIAGDVLQSLSLDFLHKLPFVTEQQFVQTSLLENFLGRECMKKICSEVVILTCLCLY